MMITDQGTIIRTPVDGISLLSRSAGGVIVMRLPEGQYVANFTRVAKEESSEESDEEISEETEETEETSETIETVAEETEVKA